MSEKSILDQLSDVAISNARQHAKMHELLTDALMDLADLFATCPGVQADPRAWKTLMIYKPKDI
jgi:hypothetical protein